MSKINAWQAAALAAGVLGLAFGYLWAGRSDDQVRTATFVPAAATASPGSPTVTAAGISVTGAGTVSGTPDALKLAMGVQVTSPTVTAALDAANAAASKVQDTLKAQGVAEKDLQTSGVSIQAQYSWANDKQTLTGYQVTESLTATLRNTKTAGAVISAAAAAGGDATRIDSVTLDLTDTGALVTKAREAAFKEAKDKAEQYAKVAGIELGDVVTITESTTQPTPPAPMYSAADGAVAKAAVPIATGSQDVVVTVSVVFGIR